MATVTEPSLQKVLKQFDGRITTVKTKNTFRPNASIFRDTVEARSFRIRFKMPRDGENLEKVLDFFNVGELFHQVKGTTSGIIHVPTGDDNYSIKMRRALAEFVSARTRTF